MIQLIVGGRGKGKTKHLLDKVNTAVKTASGNIVYLDKNSKHMYELKNKIRLINVSEYPLNSPDEFVGFICGIVSQDHDLEQMYFDSFLNISCLEGKDISTMEIQYAPNVTKEYNAELCETLGVTVPSDYVAIGE